MAGAGEKSKEIDIKERSNDEPGNANVLSYQQTSGELSREYCAESEASAASRGTGGRREQMQVLEDAADGEPGDIQA